MSGWEAKYPDYAAAVDWWDTIGKEEARMGPDPRLTDAEGYDRVRDDVLDKAADQARKPWSVGEELSRRRARGA